MPGPIWARLGMFRGGSILCFHSVATADLPSANPANIALDQFDAIVREVKRFADVVPLRMLLALHDERRRTAGLVAFTFDDAYEALLSKASGIIRRERLPLTVFVTTDATRLGQRFWWDRVEDAFSRTKLPRWRAFEDSLGLPEAYRSGQPPAFGPLRPLRQWILATERGRWPTAFEAPLAELEAELGLTTAHRAMAVEEIRQLRRLGHIDIGVHTASHPVLPLLEDEEISEEIGGCYRQLRSWFPDALPVLAVPFGLCDERTLRIAVRTGMQASLTLAPRTLGSDTGSAGLPRFGVTAGQSPKKLLMKMTGYANGWLIRRAGWHGRFPDLPSATT